MPFVKYVSLNSHYLCSFFASWLKIFSFFKVHEEPDCMKLEKNIYTYFPGENVFHYETTFKGIVLSFTLMI